MQSGWMNSITRFTSQHAPAILSGVAITGVAVTTVLAVRVTPKAARRLEDLNRRHLPDKKVSDLDRVREVWTLYIPAAISGIATASCIIGANKIGANRNAALAAAYALAHSSFQEYKDKVIEQLGENKEKKIRDEVAISQMEKAPPPSPEVIILGGGEQLCFDSLTGRHFKSNIEAIRKAENDLNARIIHDMFVAQNDFYEILGLETVEVGEVLGWNIDNRMELHFTSYASQDPKSPYYGMPALSVGYKNLPIAKYLQF